MSLNLGVSNKKNKKLKWHFLWMHNYYFNFVSQKKAILNGQPL